MFGVFGIVAPGGDAARLAALGLFALPQRGQESAGIAASDGDRLMVQQAAAGVVAGDMVPVAVTGGRRHEQVG